MGGVCSSRRRSVTAAGCRRVRLAREVYRCSSTDHGPPNQNYLEQLRRHVMKKAAVYLALGEQLSIKIKDIDMAGEFEPWNTPGNDIRMIRHIYPPRVELHYQLKDAEGNVLKEGQVRLTEPNYQMRSVQNSQDTMRYEKALLDDWLASTFSGRATRKGLNPES